MGDGLAWTEALAAVVSVLGALGSLLAWFVSRRDAKKAAIERKAEAQEEAERMAALVRSAQEQVARFERLASSAEDQASSASRSASGVESIASVLSPRRLVVEWESHQKFRLRNCSAAPVSIEAIREPQRFVRRPFDVPVTVHPGTSVDGIAFDANGVPFPGELVLDIVGEDAPVVVPTSGRPPRL